MSQIVYLSLGSNLGDRQANLRSAISRLQELGKVTAVSSFYETQPVDLIDQPWFINAVVEFDTELGPQELMAAIIRIEEDMGRRRITRKGPRTIDIDLLLFGQKVIDEPGLTVPHPAMHQRRFVLEPLAELAPKAEHPVIGRKIEELRDVLPLGQAVRRIPEKR